MECPRCHNKRFTPSEDVKYPLLNMGNKEKYESFDLRRYVCMQCGYKFITIEQFYRDVKTAPDEHINLFPEEK